MELCPIDIGLTFLGPHFVFCLLVPFRDGERKRKNKDKERTEGHGLMSHFANSLQPTLSSQCYTYSTSPKALNSRLSFSRTIREKHTAFSTLCTFD